MSLEQLVDKFTTPCDWSREELEERGFHCAECDRQVIDLSAMTEAQAESYLEANPRSCVTLRLDGALRPIFREPMQLRGRPGWQGKLASAALSLPMLLAGCDSGEERPGELAPIALAPDGARLKASDRPGASQRAEAPEKTSQPASGEAFVRDAERVFVSYPSGARVYKRAPYGSRVYLGETPLTVKVLSGVRQDYVLELSRRRTEIVDGEPLESGETSRYFRWLEERDRPVFDRANETVVTSQVKW